MICAFVRRSQGLPPTWRQLEHAIRRNFDGLDNVNPMEVFSNIMHNIDKHAQPRGDDPDCTASGLIRGSLQGKGQDSESRYLLILTENYAALGLLQQQLPDIKNAMVIFGSSFPRDQQYTQVCRNINRIKGCMEAGKTVILLNLENLYESLYDALNQYYVEMGGNRFVDLGLGTMRVKCKVHPDFRLIVVAEKQVVYKKFPIPLINRLEKHFLAMTTMLESGQHRIVDILDEWIHRFITVNIPMHLRRGAGQQPKPGDVFIGFHADTTASIVLQVCKQMPFHPENEDRDEYTAKVIEKAQELLLNCATPEALIRQTQLTPQEADRLARMYVREQKHDSLLQYLQHELLTQQRTQPIFVQVTTHAKLLSGHQDRLQLAEELHLQPHHITIRALQAFDTEQQFCKVLREFFINTEPEDKLLIIQCDSGDKNSDLIACARHNIFNESMQAQQDIDAPSQPPGGGGRRTGMCHVVFVIQLPRVAGGCFVGFQGGKWKSVHIDDLHTQNDKVSMLNLKNQSVSSLFEVAILADRPKTEAGLDLQDLDKGWTEHLLQEALQSVESREEEEEMDLEDMQLHDSDSGLAVESMSSDDVTQSPRSSDLSRDTSNTTFMDIDLPSDDENPSQGNHTVEVPPGGISETPPHGNHTVEVPPGGISTRMEYDLPEKAGDTQELRRQTEESDQPETGLTEVLDVNVLLKSCIQGASSMLSDVCAERTTKRIQLLLSLMDLQTEGEDSLTFLEVVRKRVYLLLKDKETTKSGAMAQQWLSKEAAALDAINKAGTFRRAWRSCLEGKIVPLLAGLLAYADTNHNLDLLTLTLPDWKTHLWLQMMFDPKMTPLTYSDLQSAQERAELTKFSVKMLGCGGQTMNNKLPFSWVIKSHIEELHHQVKTSPSHVENMGPFLCVMVERGPLGGALDAAYASVGKDEVVDTYVQDFVRMMYTSNSQTPDIEYQLVMGAIHDAMRELGVDQEPLVAVKGTMSKSLPAVHIAYSAICGRMQHLSLLVKVWPECISRLWNFVSSQPDHPLNTDQEMTLDILALQCVLEELTPKPHQTRDARGRLRWLQRVEELQPVIERILASVTQHGYHSSSYGPKCQQVALQQRHIWQRMRAVQLFYEYVLHPGRKEDQLSKFPIPIWKTLKDDCNFKTAATMQAVQKILQTVNKNASKFFLKLDSPCCMCEEPMKDPVLLPCEHIVCQSCLKDLKLNGDLTCPQCNVPYPEGFDISPMEDKREAIEAHNQYKRRCNTFFMELVSQLCFGEGGPPEPAVIENLMCCVTRQSRRDETARLRTTKKLTIFDDCIDPTPVVRSVLLQLLLRSNIEVVREHLGQYLYQAQQLLHEEEEIVQLGILFIQCLEDSHHSEMMQQENTDGATITKAIRELRNARTQMREPGLNIGPLESIAQIRFCLAVTASWMHRVYIARDDGMTLPDVKRLCDAASYICDSRDVKWPRIYLLRILARQYGMEAIKKLSKIPNLRWLMPPEARKDEDEVSADRFVVYGDQYKEIRNSTAQVMLVANTTVIDEAVKEVGAAESGTLLQLSLYREVTGTLTRQTLAKLQTYCQGAAYLTQKEFAERILSNQIGRSCHHLNGVVGEEGEDRMLAEIVVHFSIIKDRLPVCALMQPLLTIMDRPQTMQKAMFPTMPQDDLVEIHEALLKARHDVRNADTNPVMWKCPNGHYYIIGDCGRPYAHRPCPDCGSMIGGQNHIPAHGNIKSTVTDTTGLGYILGAPGQRRTEAIPERHMSPATTALLRFLLHAAMYHATDTKPREVASLIKPAIPAEGVAQFLWMHMKRDLEVIAKATGHSLEDSATCLHLLVKYLVTPPPGGVTVDPTLSNKAARQSWEDAFSKAYILPVLTDLDGQLHAANQAIVNDNRLGNNLLMKLLYETDICIEPEPDLNDVYNVEAFWRFRPRISLQHLTHHLNEHIAACRDNQNQVPRVLQRFLQLEHHLRVMRYLPNIVRLLRMLTQRYNRRIDHHEATSLKLQDFLRKLPRGAVRDEYSTLIEDFAKAWNCIRGSLHTFTFSNMVVPKEYCDEEIGDQTRLALLLPSMKGEGICATGLVHYLVTLHNDFMEEYCHIKGHKFDTVMTLDQVTPANVIFYDPDRDLLPLVMANCNYSLAVGQSTTITYDFNAVETQLEERLLRGKPKLEMMIEHVIFREDMTSATVFSRLEEKIKQEEMTPMTAKNIRHDLQHLPEVSQCLADLDIAMGFLTSVGGEPHSPLVAFMEKTLKMDVTICSPQIRSCQLCHVKSLWLLLSHERTKMLLNYGQDVFDQIEEPFLEVMEGDARDGLQVALQGTNVDVFLAQLYECILLQITTKQDVNDEDYVDYTNIPLRDLLIQYMAEKEQHPELAALENGHFPGEILGKHCVDVWRVAFTYGKQRR